MSRPQNNLSSHINCLEETGHHVEAHCMWHLLLLNDCCIERVEQRRHKIERIFRDLHPWDHTQEVAHDPDLTIP